MLLRSLKNARVQIPRQGGFVGSSRSFATPLNSPVLPGKPPAAPSNQDQQQQQQFEQEPLSHSQQQKQQSTQPQQSSSSILDQINEDKYRKNVHEMAPESPSPVDAGEADSLIREMLLSCLVDIINLRKISTDSLLPSLNELHSQLYSNANVQLPYSLPYEPTPDEHRKIDFKSPKPEWSKVMQFARNPSSTNKSQINNDNDDGIALVAHVFNDGGKKQVSYSMGFGLQGPEDNGGNELVLSCSHTLEAIHAATESSKSSKSCTLILTRAGKLYPASRIASSLPENDLVLYQLGDQLYTPHENDINSNKTKSISKIRTLPMNPYPAREHDKQMAHLYANAPGQSSWVNTDILGYVDSKGCEAKPGTYDDLASLSLSIIPTPGSSGAPVVDRFHGSITGILRGSRFQNGDKRAIGFATPAEKIFEMFRLPGFTTTLEREQQRQQKSK